MKLSFEYGSGMMSADLPDTTVRGYSYRQIGTLDAAVAAKAQAIFKTYADAAKKMPALFPDTSKTGGETTANPKIWEDQAGFKAAFAKFETDAAAGATVANLDGFRTAFGAATKNCGTCHEVYRIKK